MLEEGNIVTLGNNHRYNVIFSTIYNNDNYVFLSNQDNIVDSCFYKNNNSKNLELVKDEETISALLSAYKKYIEEV